MSYTETHFGKLRKVDMHGHSLEDWCRMYCRLNGIQELSSYNNTWEEQFRDVYYEKFFINGNEVWEVIEHQEIGEDDISKMILNGDGTIIFVMQFYNGGTCLSEMIEEGLEKLKNE